MKLLNVAVLMGGVSPEHDISLRSGATLLTHLSEARYRTRAVVILKDGTWAGAEGRPSLEEIRSLSRGERPEIALAALRDWGLDAAVLALHGPNGEDGSIQGLLQSAGIPYTGSGVEASAVCMNKHLAKLMAARTGVLLAEDFRKIPGGRPASQVHLKQPVLRRHIADRKHQVAPVIGVNMGNAVGVAVDVNLRRQALQLDCACQTGKRSCQIYAKPAVRNRAGREDNDENEGKVPMPQTGLSPFLRPVGAQGS